MADIQSSLDLAHPGHQEEEDVCRVCRVEGDEADPLIYPCKCSGSVRFVHPDCLRNWLAHSQKRYCEICGHHYTFTKVYMSIPTSIPATVFVRQALLRVYRVAYHLMRFWLAVIGWLVILPALNMAGQRVVIWGGDQVTPSALNATISNTTLVSEDTPSSNTTILAAVAGSFVGAATRSGESVISFANSTLHLVTSPVVTVEDFFSSAWRNYYAGDESTLPGFVFRGQAISILVAALLLAIMTTREFLIHHFFQEDRQPEKPEDELEEIVPDDWVIKGGVAYRKEEWEYTVKWKNQENKMWARRRRMWERRDKIAKASVTAEHGSVTSESQEPLASAVDEADLRPGDDDAELEKARALVFGTLQEPQEEQASTNTVGAESGVMVLEDLRGLAADLDASLFTPGGTRRPAGLPGREGGVAYIAPELLGLDKDREVDFFGRDDTAGPSRTTPPRAEGEKGEDVEDVGTDDPMIPPWEKFAHDPIPAQPVWGPDTRRGPPSSGAESDADSDAPPPGDGPGRTPTEQPFPEDQLHFVPPMPEPVRIPLVGQEELEFLPPRFVGPGGVPADAPPPMIPRNAPLGQDELNNMIDNVRAEARQRRQNREEADREAQDALMAEDLGADEEWGRDNWREIFELAGLLGPINNLIQNVLLAIVVICSTTTIFVGIPLFIGRMFLSIDVYFLTLGIVSFVFKVIRLVTDPIVDIVVEITKDVVLLPLLSSYKAFEGIIVKALGLGGLSLTVPSTSHPELFTTIFGAKEGDSWTGDLLAKMGANALEFYEAQRTWSVETASSRKTSDLLLCVLTGYAFALMVVSIAAVSSDETLRRISPGLPEQVKQVMAFIKLTFFLIIDMGLLPVLTGLTVNVSLVPLFDGATVLGRITDFAAGPFAAILVNWLLGAGFSMSFGGFLALLRRTVRPGAMFFLRDPSDPSFSPIKEHMEKPTLFQLRRLSWSMAIHAVLVFWTLGAVCWSLKLQPFIEVLPLKLNNMPPLSSVPFDLLFVHLAIPTTYEAVRPLHKAKHVFYRFWRYTACMTDLTSLIFGKAIAPTQTKESYKLPEWIWPILNPIHRALLGRYDVSATHVRAPYADGLVLRPAAERQKEGVFVPVNEDGAPRTDEGKLLLLKQDRHARMKGRNPKLDYTVVWLPKYWKVRAYFFASMSLNLCAVMFATATYVPLLVGRAALGQLGFKGIHDGYNWICGLYISIAATKLGYFARRRIHRSARAGRVRRSEASKRVKRSLRAFAARVWAVVLLFGALPIELGILFELAVSIPARYGFDPDAVPVLHLWDAWSIGVALSLCFSVLYPRAPGDALSETRRFHLAGLRMLLRKPFTLGIKSTTAVVAPIMGVILLQIVTPFFTAAIFAQLSAVAMADPARRAIISRMMYPVMLLGVLAVFGRDLLIARLGAVRQQMIDAEYVREERVENYDPAQDAELQKEKEAKQKEAAKEEHKEAAVIQAEGIDATEGDTTADSSAKVSESETTVVRDSDGNVVEVVDDDDDDWVDDD